jgi:RES domain-containing protein
VPLTYRARRFRDGARPTDPLAFGPPPVAPAAGRYNRAGQSALYLGMDPRGLSAEMAQYAKPGEHLYFARYLPIASLSMVDMSDASAHAALHLAFDRAERLDLDYEAAQRLADVVRELCIDGIIVPGVRGTKAHHYRNVVIFNCLDWATWIDTSYPPELLFN